MLFVFRITHNIIHSVSYIIYVNYVYSNLLFCLSTSRNLVDCKILPRHADNVSDHLPICLWTSVRCEQPVKCTGTTPCPKVTPKWDTHDCAVAYNRIVQVNLGEMQNLTCDLNVDTEISHRAIDDYVEKLNCIMHDSAREAGCYAVQHYKRKAYWCPELSYLRDRKRFWWKVWVDCDRPREGALYNVYKSTKKNFRRRSRHHVTSRVTNEHAKLYSMLKSRNMTGFWKVIQRKRCTQVKSSLSASNFDVFYSNIMRALPDDTHEQSCDRVAVERYYTDNCDARNIQNVRTEQVNQFILRLKRGKAPGMDGISHEHLIFGNSEVLRSLLASLYSSILSTGYVPKLFTTGVIIPVIKKSTLDPDDVSSYRPITISSVHTKAIESFIIPCSDISDNQFGFRNNRGTAFACNLLNDVASYCKSRNSTLFLATLDAEKCFDSICHVSLFLKLIDVLPVYQWILLYNWYKRLEAVVKWEGSYSGTFAVGRGTRQGSIISPFLFNIFINQLLLDLTECDAGVRIGDELYNSMAYADDITLFATNVKGVQCLIDTCATYSNRWRFRYGIEKSKCMVIGKSPFTCEPLWRLNNVVLRNVDSIEILGNVFNSKCNNTNHVDIRVQKCRQSFFGLSSTGMSYPGAPPEVQAYIFKSICQSTLTYGMECMEYSAVQMRRMESIQGRLIKQCLGLGKRSHNTAILKALNIDSVQSIVNRNIRSLYYRIFRIESPTRRLMQFLLAHYITDGTTIPGTLIDRLVHLGDSPIKGGFVKPSVAEYNFKAGVDGLVDTVRHLLHSEHFCKRTSEEHHLVRLLTNAIG